MPRRLTVLLTAMVAFALVPAAAARADWFPAQAIDGPNANIVSVGGVDLARDGEGGVAYLRIDQGVPHVFVSRLVGGTWRAPERIDGDTGAVTEVKIAAGDGGRLAVAWVAAGYVWASEVEGGNSLTWTPPVELGGPFANNLDLDLGINGAAYAVWQDVGDVRAARLQDTTWSTVVPALDINQADEAGTGNLRPRVAVSAEGYAVATWGEIAPDGTTHVYARRLTRLALSVAPQDLNVPGGGPASEPDIDIEDDGSFAWVVFTEAINGVPHTFGRRLIGSLFDPPEELDNGQPSSDPAIDMSGDGEGEAVAQLGSGGVLGANLDNNTFSPYERLDTTGSTIDPLPVTATGDREDSAVAYRVQLPDGTSQARARFRPSGESFGPDTVVSNPAYGPVDDPGVFIGGDRVGDFAVAMVQGTDAARTLTAAVYDRPPGTPFIAASQSYKRQTRPNLRWNPGLDLWGAQVFKVFVDGKQIGQTSSSQLTPKTPIPAGKHTWQVQAVDKAGQATPSRTRTLLIDSLAPKLKVSVSGKRAAGQALKITVTAKDVGGSGLDHVTVDFGDGSPTTHSTHSVHRYSHGHHTLKVAAVDKAGNVARYQLKLTIKK